MTFTQITFDSNMQFNIHDYSYLTKCIKLIESAFCLFVLSAITHDPMEIANEFNSYFTSVASKYRTTCDKDLDLHILTNFVRRKISQEIKFTIPDIDHAFVSKYLSSLQPSKAVGLDGISAKLLRIAAPTITANL